MSLEASMGRDNYGHKKERNAKNENFPSYKKVTPEYLASFGEGGRWLEGSKGDIPSMRVSEYTPFKDEPTFMSSKIYHP